MFPLPREVRTAAAQDRSGKPVFELCLPSSSEKEGAVSHGLDLIASSPGPAQKCTYAQRSSLDFGAYVQCCSCVSLKTTKKKKRSFFFLNYIKIPNVKFVLHCYNVIQSEIGQNPFNRFSTSTTSAGTCRPITHPTNPGGWLSRLMFPSPLRRKENSSESSGMAKLPGEGMVR